MVYYETSMTLATIPYANVPRTTALHLDYVDRFDRVARFYGGSPDDLLSYQRVAAGIRSELSHRRKLVEILIEQNQRFGCTAETEQSIRSLEKEDTFAVLTGQQVGLFSGPVFTLYKALTTVHLARRLTEQGVRCVPVFWLAAEDHDLEEVVRTAVLDKEGVLTPLEAPAERPAPDSPVGTVRLGAGISGVLDQLQNLLPAGEARDHLMGDLRQCYAPGATWSEAFGRLIARLFGRFGVVLIDPLDARLHELASGVYRLAIEQAPRLRERLHERSRALVDAGYHAQVHVGEDSTLLFLTVNGGRHPLRQRGEWFEADGASTFPAELERRIAATPLDFTPSALLRPVVQDSLLPTIACVPGPAELAYFAQCMAIYEEFGRPAPVLFPRAAFTLAERRLARLLEKYGATLEDVWQGENHLRRKLAAASLGTDADGWPKRLERGEEDLRKLFEDLRGSVERIDPTLLDSLTHTREKIEFHLERLRGKVSRAALDRSEILRRHEEELLRFLTPAGGLQERVVSGVYFVGRAGYGLLDALLGQIDEGLGRHCFAVY